jgi:hypothetical protein
MEAEQFSLSKLWKAILSHLVFPQFICQEMPALWLAEMGTSAFAV